MTGRFTLVVGSQCELLNELSFVNDSAAALHRELVRAGWRGAGGCDGLLLNPTTAQLKTEVREAFGAANAAGATLLFGFVGHGVSNDQDFFLMAQDSQPEGPDDDSAFNLVQFIGQRLGQFISLDGLVLLVDACEAGQGVQGAATRWREVVAANRSRMEMLVASGTGSAYDGCFTKTVLDTFESGRDAAGENLLAWDLKPAISERCVATPVYLAFDGAHLSGGDPGLWLVRNIAREHDAVTGRPAAGLVDQLIKGMIATASTRRACERIGELGYSAPLRLVVGPAGSGKSTLLSLFIRPKTARALGVWLEVPDDYIRAAVFLDKTSTLQSLTGELALQLRRSVPEFSRAHAAVADELELGADQAHPAAAADPTAAAGLTHEAVRDLASFDAHVVRPLARCQESGRIHLIVDGLDQPQQGARDVILTAVQRLTHTTPTNPLGHVRVIAGVRGGEGVDSRKELAHGHRIDITPPTVRELAQATIKSGLPEAEMESMIDDATGGWMIARLIREIADRTAVLTEFRNLGALVSARVGLAEADLPGSIDPLQLLSALAAAGFGPVLPIRLLAAALGPNIAASRVRDVVGQFGALISRGNPGTDHETLGISHLSLIEPITDELTRRGLDPAASHQSIIDGFEYLAGTTDSDSDVADDDITTYWTTAAPRHYLEAGQPGRAIEFLAQHDNFAAADNRDRWAGWLTVFTAKLGADHHATLTARAQLARWRGAAGNAARAVSDFEALVKDSMRVLGPDHRETLTARAQLARWRGETGDAARAVDEFEALVKDSRRVLGPDHRETLTARAQLARWRGETGDAARAVDEFQALLEDSVHALGPGHPDTLTARHNVAHWQAVADQPAGWFMAGDRPTDYALVRTGEEVADGKHIVRLGSIVDEAHGFGTTMQQIRAKRFHGRRIRLSGSLRGSSIEGWAGLWLRVDGRRGIQAFDNMQNRPLKGTTDWTQASVVLDVDDEAHGIAFGVLLAGKGWVDIYGIRFETVSADVPTTDLRVEVLNLAEEADEVVQSEAQLHVQERLLGPYQPDTLRTRRHLAQSQAEEGNTASAVAEFEALLQDSVRELGPDHSDTLIARADLAYWRGEAGDATEWMMAGTPGCSSHAPGGVRPSDYVWVRTGERIDGKQVMQLRSIVDEADNFGTAMQAINAIRYRGVRIRLSGSLRASSVEGWAGLWLRVDGRHGTQAFDNMHNRALRGTTDWTDASVVLDVDDEAHTIAFGVLLAGKGSVEIYDARFETVTADIPTTDMMVGAEEPTNLEPINLDFEQ